MYVCTLEVSGAMYFGSASFEFEWDVEEGKAEFAPPMVGIGYKWGVDIDWK